MRSVSLSLSLSSLALFSVLVACGGGTPPKTATPPVESTEVDASATAASTTPNEAPPVASDATSDAGATNASAAASAASPGAPSAPDIVAQGQAECSGVAGPFEEHVRAKFNDCYQAGKKKNPELAGTIKVTLKIDMNGKVTKYVPDPSKLDKPVFDCMVKVVKKEPFDGKACRGKDVTVSKTYGR